MARYLTIILAFASSGAAIAETVIINATGHYVPLNEPEWIELEDNRGVFPGYRRHITAVGEDEKIQSHWCSGTNVENETEFEFGAGYCTIFDEDGDAYWTWFQLDGEGAFERVVMGGTGKYEGSSGTGVSMSVNVLPDGTAVFRIEGKIELVDSSD